jgi:hypothetical protein
VRINKFSFKFGIVHCENFDEVKGEKCIVYNEICKKERKAPKDAIVLGITGIDEVIQHESKKEAEEQIRKLIGRIGADRVVVTQDPSRARELKYSLRNDEVSRFFKGLHIEVEKVTAEDKGDFEVWSIDRKRENFTPNTFLAIPPF